MEGQLNQDDSILKVAVKTMKSESVHTCAHIWDPHPLASPSQCPKGGRRAEELTEKLALPQNLRVTKQEMKFMLGTSTGEI